MNAVQNFLRELALSPYDMGVTAGTTSVGAALKSASAWGYTAFQALLLLAIGYLIFRNVWISLVFALGIPIVLFIVGYVRKS